MNTEVSLLKKRLAREKNARQQADILLDQKSLQLWEANCKLQVNLDEKSSEIQTLNNKLTTAFKNTSTELYDNLNLLNEYKKAIDYSTIVSITNAKGQIIYVNDAFSKNSGYTEEELIGSNHNIIRHPDNPVQLYKNMWEQLLNKKPWHGVIKNLSKDKKSYYVDTTITPILDKDGKIEKFLALRYNITQVIEQEKRINRQLTDRLTDLPNRTKLIEDLENNMYQAITILNIDLFQEINDLYGQTIGDELLKSFALYLSKNLRNKNYLLYKLPADEFVIASNTSMEMEMYKKVIERLIKSFDQYIFHIDGNEITVSVTGGISKNKYGINMLSNAEIALKKAKLEKLPFILFDKEMNDKKHYAKNQEMIITLKNAIKNDRIIPYFQPIFSNTTMKIEKYEILIRLINDEGKIISPLSFLKIAKKSRMYRMLTKIIIQKSFEVFKDKNIHFAINLSIEDIVDSKMQTYIFNKLKDFTCPQNVIFEITESEGIDNYNIIKEFLEKVKTYGVQIAIDDFGSGYSNFMHLLELEVDFIKIDGSIIKNIIDDRNSQILTKAIVSMAKELNIKVIAEYVSTEAILNMVKSIGVDHSQGFYLGEPLSDIVK